MKTVFMISADWYEMLDSKKLTTGLRIYAFEKHGRIRRLPIVMFSSLARGMTRMVEYEDERLRVLMVALLLEGRATLSVHSVFGSIWHFDADGSPAESLQNQIHPVLCFLKGKYEIRDSVIDITSCLEKKKFYKNFHGNRLLKT
jgi:hypothetical protein